jgi:hypothetical protein
MTNSVTSVCISLFVLCGEESFYHRGHRGCTEGTENNDPIKTEFKKRISIAQYELVAI